MESIIIAIIGLIGSLFGSYLLQSKTVHLVDFRVGLLEKKFEDMTTYNEKIILLEERILVINKRIKNLEVEVNEHEKRFN